MAIESQGAKLEMAGAGGAAKTITAIALGYPTILTSTAHGLTNGEVVTLANFAGADASLLNGQACVITRVTTNTFSVDINTTEKTVDDNTDTATATPKAWTEICEVVDGNREDPGATEINVTHLRSTAKEYLMGLEDPGSYTFSVNWLFDDIGQTALRAAKTARTLKVFRVTYSDAATATFSAYVQTFSGPSLAVDDKVSGSITLRISGAVTFA